ncbi:hypothetical protein, partial [Lentimonas sp. CC11]|uniref:hypothetical protein n=2 Tax=unclassified Lentimonas TaxID=2630993 RepID=UPI001A7EFA40
SRIRYKEGRPYLGQSPSVAERGTRFGPRSLGTITSYCRNRFADPLLGKTSVFGTATQRSGTGNPFRPA